MKTTAARTAGVVIIGGGHAGGRCAERLRAFGYEGSVTLIGKEKWQPYERPPLSKAVLTGELSQPPCLLDKAAWCGLDISFHAGVEALAIDRAEKRVVCAGSLEVPYEKVVLATGLIPRSLQVLECLGDRVRTLHNYDDAIAIREGLAANQSLALIGAGFIGMEIAASARGAGIEVSIIEVADRPLMRVMPACVAGWLAQLHHSNGVRLHTGRQVIAARLAGVQCVLTLDDETEITASGVVAGIGGSPATALASKAGLNVQDGVVVDQACRTSDPDIYAIGDIAFHVNEYFGSRWRLESWKNAEDTAAVAARAICGEEVRYHQVPWFWTDQFERNIQIVGMPSQGSVELQRGDAGKPGYVAYYMDGDRLRGAIGLDAARDIRRARGIIEKDTRLTRQELAAQGFVQQGGEGQLAKE